PEPLIQRVRKAGRGDAAREEGMNICAEMIQELSETEGVHGVHIMAVEWEEAVQPIVERAGRLPRPTA
ncbi:MAG: methylenetetrahydrofolate reductase, partial [Chloroflexi bacterium]|nr:methylenetetrahydrofolate reductase [Chloroflexota bacterium]